MHMIKKQWKPTVLCNKRRAEKYTTETGRAKLRLGTGDWCPPSVTRHKNERVGAFKSSGLKENVQSQVTGQIPIKNKQTNPPKTKNKPSFKYSFGLLSLDLLLYASSQLVGAPDSGVSFCQFRMHTEKLSNIMVLLSNVIVCYLRFLAVQNLLHHSDIFP